MTRPILQDSPSQPAVYKSLGLSTLLRFLRDDRKPTILDLGPALGANVEFWSRHQCRLHIEDFYRDFIARASNENEESKASIFADLLAFNEELSFDIVLTWDLFNYLDLAQLEGLVRHVSRFCKPGAALFALISSQPDIPDQPTVFRILDTERMVYETRTQITRPCPRHQPREVAKAMGLFQVSSSFLLRNGIQEYVFVRGEDPRP
jgi:2-polyprenyl-3-methyl-5-hydroxy-6-metoxy-1,4-benzoquinol methylase